MTEENVTRNILIWLKENRWRIVSYDFPQSGTGLVIHPNEDVRDKTKNKGVVVFDIIAVRKRTAVFFENKDRFCYDDFKKVDYFRKTNDYSAGISRVLRPHSIESRYYGIGGPDSESFIDRSVENTEMVDFLVAVSNGGSISILEDTPNIFGCK